MEEKVLNKLLSLTYARMIKADPKALSSMI